MSDARSEADVLRGREAVESRELRGVKILVRALEREDRVRLERWMSATYDSRGERRDLLDH